MDPVIIALEPSDDSSEDSSSDEDASSLSTMLALCSKRQRDARRRLRKVRKQITKRIQRRKILLERCLALEPMDEPLESSGRGRNRSCWVRPLGEDKDSNVWKNSSKLDDAEFQKKYRLSRESFRYILNIVSPLIKKRDTNMRKAIPPDFRMAVAIYVLKNGCGMNAAADAFKIGRSTVNVFVLEFCKAVNGLMWKTEIKFPVTMAEKLQKAREFETEWKFPCTIGSLDATHIPIATPPIHPQDYYNYKQYHSIVVLGLVDANYKFMYVNVGRPGGVNDAKIFLKSKLKEIVTDEKEMGDLHIIGDGAFPLMKGLMKPFMIVPDMTPEQQNFNARLAGAGATAKDSFDRLKSRWRILAKRSEFNADHAVAVVKTCLILHNVCEKFKDEVHKSWQDKARDLESRFPQPDTLLVATNTTQSATSKRDELMVQLMTDSAVTSITHQ